jgi:phospholipid/cholesterol/gamma-HCH transport system substrate-binding protein
MGNESRGVDEMKKYAMETTVGIFVVIGLLGIGYMTVKLGNIGLLGDKTYPLYAKFSSISGLRQGSAVEMLGIEVGRVENFTMDQEEQVAVVEFRIKQGIKIYEDAIASIKTEGLIGDRYVSIDPGGGFDVLLGPGDFITETESPTDIQELISKYAFGDVQKK